jgi:hypothetical protein
MSSFPFVQVEGALSLPYIRPLAPIPASFGREWALTDPQFSLRTELRALYAAIMRTVCMSVEAFRAAARWDHRHSPFPLEPAPVAAPVAPVMASAAAAVQARTTPGTSRMPTPPVERNTLAASAVAIGGAALLTWIIASHAPHDTATSSSKANSPADATARQDASQRLADARAEHDEHATSGVVQQRAAQAPVSAPTPTTDSALTVNATPTAAVAPRAASAPALASVQGAAQAPVQAAVKAPIQAAPQAPIQAAVQAPVHAAAQAPVQAPAKAPFQAAAQAPMRAAVHAPVQAPVAATANTGKAQQTARTARSQPNYSEQAHTRSGSPARLVQRDVRNNSSAARRDATQRVAKPGAKQRLDVQKFEPYREARPVTTHRPNATYSEARVYSPHQTSANQADEYSSILTYANTYTAARPSNRAAAPVDNTDWVNHVSQRRVTEVPDRFAK